MRFKTWPVAALGLASLLIVIAASLSAASRKAQEIYIQLDQLNTRHREFEAKLRRLRSDVHLSGIFVRDYLLDQEGERAPGYRQRLAELRHVNLSAVGDLRVLALHSRAAASHRIDGLETRLEQYWRAFDPLFDWTPAEKQTRSAGFLRREVVPRREAVLAIAQEIEQLNNANLEAQRAEVERRHQVFRADLSRLLWQSVLLGSVVAAVAVARLRTLERRSVEQREMAEEAREQMRRLSQQLVATQEEERRKLSRELHDHVGQVLTALRMELGRIERLRVPSNTRLAEAVVESRALVDDMVQTVRDLALGLRPSMLDDCGLQAALEWHARDFARRYALPVEVTIDGDFDQLQDQQRTCVYRVVQEALTNCAKHSGASRVDLRLRCRANVLELTIADDGRGFEARGSASGLGLRGIEERVRDLGGTVRISGAAGSGTTLAVRLPVGADATEADHALASG